MLTAAGTVAMGRNKRSKRKSQAANTAPSKAVSGNYPTAKAVLAGTVTAIFVLRPLYPSESAAAEGDGMPVVMLWILAFILWGIMVARGNISRIRFGWPDITVALLVLWHTIAALRAVVYESPRPALNMLWEWLAYGVAFFLARQAFSSSLQRRAVGAVMIALAVLVSFYGLYQYSIELPAMRDLYKHSPDAALRDAGLWFPPGSPGREQFEQRLASLEPMATFALTNSLAGFLVPWAMVTLGASAVFFGRLSSRQRITIASLLVPLGLCLLLTKSRSAYLACACGGVAMIAIAWGSRWAKVRTGRKLLAVGVAVALIGGAVLTAMIAGGLDAEVLSEAPKSLGYRLQYWQASATMIRDLPVFGCGPGNFQHHYTAYKLPEASEEITDPHNFIMEIWATAGTPALVIMLGAGVVFFVTVLRSNRKKDNEPDAALQETGAGTADVFAVFFGAAGGMLLSLPIGLMSAAPPSWLVPLIGLPVTALVLGLLFPWIAGGEDSAALWTLSASVLLIHLLFSGALAFPGITMGLWLLAALALDASETRDRSLRTSVGIVALAGSLPVLVACFATGYQPTLVARALVAQAYHDDGDRHELLTKAAKADPWAAGPYEHLADLCHQQWLMRPSEETLAEFERAVNEALTRAPRSASLRHKFGLAYWQCFDRSSQQELLNKAIGMLESAVAMYPNDCQKRADLAEAYLRAGDLAQFERQRDEALRLDEVTPHLDKKLKDEQRQRLTRSELAPELCAPTPE